MKRPPSVTTAIFVLSFLSISIAAAAWTLYTRSNDNRVLSGLLVFLAIFVLPIYGLFARRNWARIYCAILFSLLSIGIIVGASKKALTNKVPMEVIFDAVVPGLFVWNIASIFSSQNKPYFRLNDDAARTENE